MPPAEVRELCRAKLNLFLEVVGRRADGFHEIVTVFHEIGLADELVARALDADRAGENRAARSVTLQIEGGDATIPTGPENLAVRAAQLLLERAGSDASVGLRLRKRIPAGGGLGGGSADAAGTLRAVNRLLGLGASTEDLETVAADLGSDVPFLVRGGSAIGRGRGERLEPVPSAGLSFVLLFPRFGLETGAVYRALPSHLPARQSMGRLRIALESGNAAAVAGATFNALEAPALSVDPRLGLVMDGCRARLGSHVRMTGSGSTLFLPVAHGHEAPLGGFPLGTTAQVVRSA